MTGRDTSRSWLLGVVIFVMFNLFTVFSSATSTTLPALDVKNSIDGSSDQPSWLWLQQIRENIALSEYFISPHGKGIKKMQAPNRKHDFRIVFDEHGVAIIPRDTKKNDWLLELRLTRFGRKGGFRPAENGKLVTNGNRAQLVRDDVTEWFINDQDGVEHGFTFHTRPKIVNKETPSQMVRLEMAAEGTLQARMHRQTDMIEFVNSNGSVVLNYSKLKVVDTAGKIIPSTMLVNDNTLAIEFDDHLAQYPVTVDPLLTSPDWSAEGTSPEGYFGYSVGMAGDVNGDGYSDIIISAPDFDGGLGDQGRVYLFYGSSSGPSSSADWDLQGTQANGYFGYSVGTAGDVNGDGYSDVVIGERDYDNGHTNEGRVLVFHGSASGLPISPSWTGEANHAEAYLGYAVGTAGDVNGDGYSDIIASAYWYSNDQVEEGRVFVYHGSSSGLSSTPAWSGEGNQVHAIFGSSVSTAGDTNGDGYDDIIIGAYEYESDVAETGEGKAYLYLGSTSGLATSPAWTVEGNQIEAYLGNAVSSVGDVNGDGYGDVGVSSYFYDNGNTNEGIAYIYHGSASGLSATPNWSQEGNLDWARFGYSIKSAGDVNGDGYGDVIVGAPYSGYSGYHEGRAWVYLGSSSGVSTTAVWSVEGTQDNEFFGYSVGCAGDVNGDGFSDIIVGATDDTQNGWAHVFYGSASGLSSTAAWFTESDQDSALLGSSVSNAGDVNGDGFSDVIIGAPNFDNGESDQGRVYVFHGSSTGLASTADWVMDGYQDHSYFGASVATAGDVNGDGFSDIVIGAPEHQNGQITEGKAYVFHGSAVGLATTPNWSDEINQVGAQFGNSVSSAGDVNGDGFSDVIIGSWLFDDSETNEGGAFVYHGSATGLSSAPVWSGGSGQESAYFGISVSTAGDVNSDGYSDIIVGSSTFSNGEALEGRAFVFQGSSSGLAAVPSWTAESDNGNARFGYSVSSGGDVNGDGFSDVIVGAPSYTNSASYAGRAFLYHGSSAGLEGSASWTADGSQTSESFGWSTASAGDVDGDGFSDIIIGSYQFAGGQASEGRVYLYHGSSSGVQASSGWIGEENQPGAHLGYSVGSGGDVNGDGYSDIIIGARQFSGGQNYEGRAFVFYGNQVKGFPYKPRQLNPASSTPVQSLNSSNRSAAVSVELKGKNPLSRYRVKLQWEVKPIGVIFNGTGLVESESWSDAGASGVVINELISNLLPGTKYHWRARLLYEHGHIYGHKFSRWFHMPFNGWNESDIMTAISCGNVIGTDGEEADLEDLISVLQVLTGMTESVDLANECNADGKIGLDESLSILNQLAE